MATTITIEITADIHMDETDVWPDGDAPDRVTAEAVKAVMEAGGSKSRVLRDWDLLADIAVHVHVGTGSAEVWAR